MHSSMFSCSLISFGSAQNLFLLVVHRERKRSGVCVKEQPSTCALCQDVLKDPVSTICGHWFCRQCITSYWDRSAQPGLCSCPQCAERSNSRASPQTVTESTGDQSKTEPLPADVSELNFCFLGHHMKSLVIFYFFQHMLVCRSF